MINFGTFLPCVLHKVILRILRNSITYPINMPIFPSTLRELYISYNNFINYSYPFHIFPDFITHLFLDGYIEPINPTSLPKNLTHLSLKKSLCYFTTGDLPSTLLHVKIEKYAKTFSTGQLPTSLISLEIKFYDVKSIDHYNGNFNHLSNLLFLIIPDNSSTIINFTSSKTHLLFSDQGGKYYQKFQGDTQSQQEYFIFNLSEKYVFQSTNIVQDKWGFIQSVVPKQT